MSYQETDIMHDVHALLEPLSHRARERVLDYVVGRLHDDEQEDETDNGYIEAGSLVPGSIGETGSVNDSHVQTVRIFPIGGVVDPRLKELLQKSFNYHPRFAGGGEVHLDR